jgi:small subunit ribosomal protein S24e
MEIIITSEKENALLSRKEIEFSITFTGATPSRKMIHDKIAAMTNTPKNQVILDSLHHRYGTMQVSGQARLYSNADELKKVEPDYLLKRGGISDDQSGADAQDAPSEGAAEAS